MNAYKIDINYKDVSLNIRSETLMLRVLASLFLLFVFRKTVTRLYDKVLFQVMGYERFLILFSPEHAHRELRKIAPQYNYYKSLLRRLNSSENARNKYDFTNLLIARLDYIVGSLGTYMDILEAISNSGLPPSEFMKLPEYKRRKSLRYQTEKITYAFERDEWKEYLEGV
jgi:hypothetical protein